MSHFMHDLFILALLISIIIVTESSVKSIIRHHFHQDSAIDEKYGSERFHFKFNLSNIPLEDMLEAAKLMLYHRGSSEGSDNFTVEIYDVTRAPTLTKQNLIDTRHVSSRTKDSWLSFDVRPADTSRRLIRLYVKLRSTKSAEDFSLKRHVDESDDSWLRERPYLVTFTDDGKNRQSLARMKRDAKKQPRKEQHDNCKRHELYVDFKDIKWDKWIVAPLRYNAYYCRGECPHSRFHDLDLNHALVQTLLNSIKPNAVSKVCCTATKMSPLEVLYTDKHGNSVQRKFENMIVERCGCR